MNKSSVFHLALSILAFVLLLMFDVHIGEIVNAIGSLNLPLRLRKVSVAGAFSLDLIGAVFPFLISVVLVIGLFLRKEIKAGPFIRGFVFSWLVALILSGVGPGGVTIRFLGLDLFVAALNMIFFYYPDSLRGFFKTIRASKKLGELPKELENMRITKRAFVNSFLLSYVYASLASLLVDLFYSSFLGFQVYVGGMGFADGVFLSGFFVIAQLTSLTVALKLIQVLLWTMLKK